MPPRPRTLLLLMPVGAALGALIALDGLHARLFGAFLPALGAGRPWLSLAALLTDNPWIPLRSLSTLGAGWLPVVVGTAWFGALAGLGLRLRWGWNVSLILAVLSLLQGGLAIALALICLIGLLLPTTRAWLPRAERSGDHLQAAR